MNKSILAVGVLLIGLAGCHGIEHLTAPTPPPPRSQTPVKMFVVMSPGELPVGGGSALLIVQATGTDGLGVETPVALKVSAGELGASELRTDKTGHATGSWTGTQTATLTATAGEVIAISSLKVNEPTKLPPPSEPRPPTPQPTPEPLPTPAPRLSVTLTATPLQVPAGSPTTLSTTVQNLNPGESVTAYQWDWDGDGTTDQTTIEGAREHIYKTDGIMAPIVKILTSGGHTASGTGQVIVSVAPPAPPVPTPTPTPTPALSVSLVGTPSTTTVTTPIAFTATATPTGAVGSIVGYVWDFGDTIPQTTPPTTTFTLTGSASHAYALSGVYTVKVTVSTTMNVSGSATFTVGVQ